LPVSCRSLLSDLFGIGIATAMQWARSAGRDWNAYVATTHHQRCAPVGPG
jgi:hypothetical protein